MSRRNEKNPSVCWRQIWPVRKATLIHCWVEVCNVSPTAKHGTVFIHTAFAGITDEIIYPTEFAARQLKCALVIKPLFYHFQNIPARRRARWETRSFSKLLHFCRVWRRFFASLTLSDCNREKRLTFRVCRRVGVWTVACIFPLALVCFVLNP